MIEFLIKILIFIDTFKFISTTVITIDNEVLNEPSIKCQVDSIVAEFRTRRPFYGRLFIKGYSSNAQCFIDYATQSLVGARNNNTVSIRVQYGTCDVRRERSVNPRGVRMFATVVVQFHSVFITKVDRSYKLSCFYKEAVHTVTNGLEVSMLTTANLVDTLSMPVCSYSVRKETANGPLLNYAKVGDRVVHRWDCQSNGINAKENPYGMLIHSCIVDDGRDNKISVIDDKGCSLDPYILDHLTYSDDLLSAYREAYVFKFADQNSLAFSCQIRLCVKAMETCTGMTPPKCAPLKNKRSVMITGKNATMFIDEQENDVDVMTDRFLVFDTDDPIADRLNDSGLQADDSFCIGFIAAFMVISSTLFLLTMMFISCSIFYLQCQDRIRKVWFMESSIEEIATPSPELETSTCHFSDKPSAIDVSTTVPTITTPTSRSTSLLRWPLP